MVELGTDLPFSGGVSWFWTRAGEASPMFQISRGAPNAEPGFREGGAHAGLGGVRTWTPAATGDSQSSSKLPGGIYAIPPVSALALAIVDLGLGLQARTGVP